MSQTSQPVAAATIRSRAAPSSHPPQDATDPHGGHPAEVTFSRSVRDATPLERLGQARDHLRRAIRTRREAEHALIGGLPRERRAQARVALRQG
jgi:hypothetical protein